MSKVTIWHNPRCSKSRQALALLENQGVELDVVLYLEKPPSRREITRVLKLLAMNPRDIIRKREPEYKDLGLDDSNMTKTELVGAMAENPKLIERPVIIREDQAVVGRPPELALKLLAD